MIFNFTHVASGCLVSQKIVFGDTPRSAARGQEPWTQWEEGLGCYGRLWEGGLAGGLAGNTVGDYKTSQPWGWCTTGHGPQPKMDNNSTCPIHNSGGKMFPSNSCCLPLRLGLAEALSLPVGVIKEFYC